jgi:L-arabonate dehydrase
MLSPPAGGYQQMDVQCVMQASEGADLDFLVGCRGTGVTREAH